MTTSDPTSPHGRLRDIEEALAGQRTRALNSDRLPLGKQHGEQSHVDAQEGVEFDGREGMTYWWDSLSTDEPNALTVRNASPPAEVGRWRLLVPPSGVSVRFFGAKGDGVADDTAAIQAAIDAALRCKIARVFLPEGRYRTTGPIHLGYGHTFCKIGLVGVDQSSYADAGFPGVIIDHSAFSDAPGIVVQGARDSWIENIALKGPSYLYATSVFYPRINAQEVSYAEISNDASWVTNIAPSGLTRYAPHAAIAIDPYAGPAPDAAYPPVSYPAWTGITAQYNKVPSSHVRIANCTIDGSYIGVAVQPNGDANGDFVHIEGGLIANCAHVLSIGNSQARNTSIKNTAIQGYHTVVSTDLIGARNGHFGGVIENVSGGLGFQAFSFTNDVGGIPVFSRFYAEGMVRIGVSAAGPARFAIALDACQFGYLGWSTGEVTSEIYNVSALEGGARVVFDECLATFTGDFAVLADRTTEIAIRHSGVQCVRFGIGSDYEKEAYNFLVGGVAALGARLDGSAMALPFLVADPHPSYSLSATIGGARAQVNAYAERIQYDPGDGGPLANVQFAPRNSAAVFDFASQFTGAAFDVATLVMSFSILAAIPNSTNAYCLAPGCILWHEGSGALFVIDSVTLNGANYDVVATMRTNYQVDANGVRSPVRPVATLGLLWLYQTFHKVTVSQYRGDLSTASPVVTNVRRSDTGSGNVPNEFKVGDLIWNNARSWDNAFWPNTTITAVAAGQITFSQPPKITATGVPIELYR